MLILLLLLHFFDATKLLDVVLRRRLRLQIVTFLNTGIVFEESKHFGHLSILYFFVVLLSSCRLGRRLLSHPLVLVSDGFGLLGGAFFHYCLEAAEEVAFLLL